VVARSRVKHIRIAIVGGGAAGFMAAIEASGPHSEVHIFEKSNKVLSKVAISGGGRCNILHDCPYVSELIKAYPRGGRSLKKPFGKFAYPEARSWFESRGLKLKVEEDGRVFPASNSSASVIALLEGLARGKGVEVHLRSPLQRLEPTEAGYALHFREGVQEFEKVILATGGHPNRRGFDFLNSLGLELADPVPSLFTFNAPQSPFKELQGLSVPSAEVLIAATKAKQTGPLLITHWGFSGPAVLKLSAEQAILLHERDYRFKVMINWTGKNEAEIRQVLQDSFGQNPHKAIVNNSAFQIPKRLWKALVERSNVHPSKASGELGKKDLNRLIEQIFRCPIEVEGKTTFKEEFVTAGGIKLSELNLDTYELKTYPGLYAVGELTNVDAITGGYNFQHAWTSGFLAGQSASS